MRKMLLFIVGIIVLSTFVKAEISYFYEITLEYNQGNISYNSIQIKPSTAEYEIDNLPGGFVAEIVSFDDKVLNVTFFDIPLTIIYDDFDEESRIVGGGMMELDEQEMTLRLPYYDDAKEINIYDKNIYKKLIIDVSSYAKKIPTEIKKPEDMIKEEEIEIKEEVEEKLVDYRFLIGVLIFVIIVFIIIFLRKKRKYD